MNYIHSCIETEKAESYTIQFIERSKPSATKINHEPHEIIMMSDANLHIK